MLECQHSSNYTFKSTTNFNSVRQKLFTLRFTAVMEITYFHHNFQMNILNPKIINFPTLVNLLTFLFCFQAVVKQSIG